MRHLKKFRLCLSVLLVLIVGSSCKTSDDPVVTEPSPTEVSISAESAVLPGTAQAPTETPVLTPEPDAVALHEDEETPDEMPDVAPLDLLMGARGFSPFADEASIRRNEQMQIEELKTLCMREQGFEYSPAPVPVEVFSDSAGLARFGDEWTDLYGYGVSTLRFPANTLPDHLVGIPAGSVQAVQQDPNLAYMFSLPTPEFVAFHTALFGWAPSDAVDVDNIEQLWATSEACLPLATRTVRDSAVLLSFQETFGEQLEALDERVRSDPRAVAHEREVSRCVEETGLRYLSRAALAQAYEPTLAAMVVEPVFADESSGTAAVAGALSPSDHSTLEAMQQEEIAIATASLSCGGGPIVEDAVLAPIYHELEEQFVTENSDALERFRDGDS